LQPTSISEEGIFSSFVVSIVTLAPVIMASMLFRTVTFVDVSDMFFCLTMTDAKNRELQLLQPV
jgi:hypothetical protein